MDATTGLVIDCTYELTFLSFCDFFIKERKDCNKIYDLNVYRWAYIDLLQLLCVYFFHLFIY